MITIDSAWLALWLNGFLRVTIVAGGGMLIALSLRYRAATCHAFLATVLAVCCAVPLLSTWLDYYGRDRFRLPSYPVVLDRVGEQAERCSPHEFGQRHSETTRSAEQQIVASPSLGPSEVRLPSPPHPQVVAQVARATHARRVRTDWLWAVASVWALGVVSHAGVTLARYRRLRQIVQRARVPTLERVDILSVIRQVGLASPPRLLSTSLIEVPIAVGWRSPCIVMPSSLIARLQTHDLRAVLLLLYVLASMWSRRSY